MRELIAPPENLLCSFSASPAMWQFVRDDSSKICARAANGAGKTYQVMYRVARHVVDNPGRRCRVAAPTKNQLREVAGRYLWLFLRPYLAPGSLWKEGTGWNKFNTVVLANGSSIELKGYKDPIDTFEGAHDLDICVLDEPPPLAILDACRRAKQLILSFTAVGANAPLVPAYRKEIEGGEESPTEGRTEHATGWVQYVVPMLRENVPWMDDDKFADQVKKYRGTAEEPQRLHAAWTGAVVGRVFAGWHPRYVLDDDAASRMLTRWEGNRKVMVDYTARYGIDHGSGHGKHRQYLIFVIGAPPRRRFLIVHEYVAPDQSRPTDNVGGMLDAIEEWLGKAREAPHTGLHRLDAAYGDINSAGPAGGGDTLNQLMDTSIQMQTGVAEMPFGRISAPIKNLGYKEAREVAMGHAMVERRWFVHESCKYAIAAFEGYLGGAKDVHKDSVDAVGYAVQDLLLEAGGGMGPRIRT